MTRLSILLLLAASLTCSSGCAWMSYLGTDESGSDLGRVYFIGGAGPIGNVVGTFDVPRGLREAGYQGSIETFGWQSVVGGTLRDQTDRERNLDQAQRLAQRIVDYMNEYPGRRVDIIALSAGTGIATWALESLPEGYSVGSVVFLASSLSRTYDLGAAMQRVDGRIHCFFSPRDPMLRLGLPITGSVDRQSGFAAAAGLYGFLLPPGANLDQRRAYVVHLRNHPYRTLYRRYGYFGMHTDSTSREFIAAVVSPLLTEPGGAGGMLAEGPQPPPDGPHPTPDRGTLEVVTADDQAEGVDVTPAMPRPGQFEEPYDLEAGGYR
jgi:pimeloyl-ACP methyl ester carboxylesterase